MASPVRFLTVQRDDPEAWALMPQVFARITAFCHRYEADTPPEALHGAIRGSFLKDDSGLRVDVALRDGLVIGHLLISLDDWYGLKVATIMQYEIDEGAGLGLERLRDVLDQAEHWARMQGAKQIQVLARVDERVSERIRAFSTFYGFRPHRVVMRKAIG